jgi:hypothetical protein
LTILIAWPLLRRAARPLRAGTVMRSLSLAIAPPRLLSPET